MLRFAHCIQRIRPVPLAFLAAAGTALTPLSAWAQTAQLPLLSRANVQAAAATPVEPVRRLSVDDVVKLALEQNLGIRIQRIDPQIQDVGIATARSFWAPRLVSNFSRNSQIQRSTSIFSGAATSIDNGSLGTGIGIDQLLPWGATYTSAWNSSRFTTTSLASNFSPQLTSNINLNDTQSLLRNFKFDQVRQQVAVSAKLRDLSDIQLQAVIAQTIRNVKNAYWDLNYAINNLAAQRQSLELAERSLRDNQRRVEVGTMAPIDIIQAQAEVALNEQNVIVAEASISQAQDRLRALIFDPDMPNFWTTEVEPTDVVLFREQAVDLDSIVRNALDKRSDVLQAKNSLQQSDVNIRYFHNQVLPDVSASVNYVAVGTGGVQLSAVDYSAFASGTIPTRNVVANRGFGSVLGDVVQNAFPNWTVGVSVNYPLGSSTAESNLARARLQYQQAQTQIKNLLLQVQTQVREAARQVQTNQRRVKSSSASRELQEKKLEAEEKKQAAGMSTTFLVIQAQRDLAQARTLEIQAISDYNKSLVDLEAVQAIPVPTLGGPGTGQGGQAGQGGSSTGSGITTAGSGAIQPGATTIIRQ
jgi:outer membrane protein